MAKPAEDSGRAPGAKPVSKMKPKPTSTVLYGRSGTGKTTLASTWPAPILYLDIKDEGLASIADVDDLDVREIESLEELDEIRDWILAQAKKGTLKYKSVVLDTMSQLQAIAVEEYADANRRKLKNKRAGDFGSLTKQDWGQISGKLKDVIMDYRDLPLETVFIAQDRAFNMGEEEADNDELAPEIGPRLMPSVASVMNASCSIIGNTFIRSREIKKKDDKTGKTKRTRQREYCLRLGPSELYVTKVRKPKGIKAPDFLVDPTYDDIMAIVRGED